MLATLLAIGLDHKRSIIFHQDQVSLSNFFRRDFSNDAPEPGPCRAGMAFELLHAVWEAPTDDNLESTHSILDITELCKSIFIHE